MNHVFVTQDYGPDRGGMARRHVELCRRFSPEEITVSTVAAPDGGAFDRGERYEIDRQTFPFARAKMFTNQARWARWLVRRCRGGGVGVLHCGNIRPAGYAVWWAHRRTGVPYVVYVNGSDVLRERRKIAANPVKRGTGRAIFGAARGVIANSAWTADVTRQLLRELGANGPEVFEIDLGTDPAQFSPYRDTGRLRSRLSLGAAPVLLTLARLVPHKGQDVAIRSLSRLAAEFPLLRYVVVGEGPNEAALRALAVQLGVAKRVIFTGPLSDTDIPEMYATASLYVGLSRLERGVEVEGFGISFVEAAASGVPSVAGDSGGVRSAVRDGVTGLVVPPTDPDSAAGAIGALLRDEDRRRAMGAAARLAVETHYNWDRVARETQELVRWLVSNRA